MAYFKGTEKGREDMCKAVEELSIKRAKDTKNLMILNMIRKYYPVEDIAEIADVTVEYVVKIKDGELHIV